jgi:hypothetical protein
MTPTEVAVGAARSAARKRLLRAVPVLGLLLSAALVAHKVRAKGWTRGGIDAALDLTPVVGRLKAVYEWLTGGDLISPPPGRAAATTSMDRRPSI